MTDKTQELSAKPTKPNRVALIVAAGQGLRTGGAIPKQYRLYHGKPMLRHSVDSVVQSGLFDRCIVMIGAGQETWSRPALDALDVTTVTGGETRQKSVLLGLEKIAQMGGTAEVFIHDAARPCLPEEIITRLVAALEHADAAIPVLPVVDSLSYGDNGLLLNPVNRENLWRVQTPQAFRFDKILAAHQAAADHFSATDDAAVAQAAGYDVMMIEGSESLRKITYEEDFARQNEADIPPAPTVRTGMGFDVHRLVAGEELWLGGLLIPHVKGLSGHSDADVALHAITDAVLGAIAAGDIGDHFPPTNPKWKGCGSDRFLSFAGNLVHQRGYALSNIDLTIICEAPKIGPYREPMRARIAEILNINISQISVKATTTEQLGTTGRGEGIAAQAIATVSSVSQRSHSGNESRQTL